MSVNGCQKGKVGEREWRDQLIKHGFSARRGRQFSGSPDSPDVVCEGLGFVHFEVKRTESLSIYTTMAQATADCGAKVPVVAHRRNKRDWLCILRAEDLLDLLTLKAMLHNGAKIVHQPPQRKR